MNNRHIQYVHELSDQYLKYMYALFVNVVSGVEENITGKRRIYNNDDLLKADVKTIFGKIKGWKNIIARKVLFPLRPFKVMRLKLFKKNLPEKDWEEFEDQVMRYVRPHIESSSEELSIKLIFMAMHFANEELKGNNLENHTYKEIEDKAFSGYIPDTFESMDHRYNVSDEIKSTMLSAYDRTAMYVKTASEDMRQSIKNIIIEGQKNNKSPSQVASDLYHRAGEEIVHRDSVNNKMTDWRRIAFTELPQIHADGHMAATDEYAKLGIQGKGKKIYKIFLGGTCEFCRSQQGVIMLQIPVSMVKGNTDKLSDYGIKDDHTDRAVWTGKSNVGRKRSEWWTCVLAHPHNTARLITFDPETQVYDEKKRKIISKVKNPFEKYAPEKYLQMRDTLNAKNVLREERKEKDRAEGIYKRDIEYREIGESKVSGNIADVNGQKYKSVSDSDYSTELERWRKDKTLPIPVSKNHREHEDIFG